MRAEYRPFPYLPPMNKFDQLDRPLWTDYDYPGSGQDETILHLYNHHFENGLLIMGTATLINSLSHNHRGQLTRLNRPGDVLDTLYFYYGAAASHPATGFVDGNYRLQNSQTPGEPGLSHFSYFYDALGNIGRIYDATHRDNQTFGYDHLNRLVTAEGSHIWGCIPLIPCYDHEYSYDGTGNFTNISRSGVLYTYHADSNQPHAVDSITGPITQTFTYDGNGNMVARHDESGSYEQEFDVENRLVAVTDTISSTMTTFFYDASGQRLLTIEPDGTEIYYPFPGYEEEITDTVTIQRSTYFLAGQAVATRISGDPDTDKNGLFFLHGDHLGSNSFMTYGPGHSSGTAGALVPGSLARYLPFGDWRAQPTADLTDIGFTGHKGNNLGSNDIGLIYMNARFYVGGLNRFASADTLVPDPTNPQSLNRYSYSYNNPLRYTDPTGHCSGEASLNWDSSAGSYVWTYTADYQACDDLRENLNSMYGIEIGWDNWVLQEMQWFELALQDMANGFGNADEFRAVFAGTKVNRYQEAGGSEVSWPLNEVQIRNDQFSQGQDFARWVFIHEFGHRLDIVTGLTASIALQNHTGSETTGFGCGLPGVDLLSHCQWDPKGTTVSAYASRSSSNRREDWGEAFAASMFGGDWTNLANNNLHGIRADALTVAADRISFVNEQIPLLLGAIDAAPTWGEP